MNDKKIIHNLQEKTQIFEGKISKSTREFGLFRLLVKNRRAVSAVMSNLILIGAVMAVGLIALGYARSMSIDYQTDYSKTINSDIGKLKESLTFEYAHYESNTDKLIIYFLNCGNVKIELKRVSVNSTSVAFSSYGMDGQLLPQNTLSSGQEGYIVVNRHLDVGIYTVKLTTGSESNFVYSLVV